MPGADKLRFAVAGAFANIDANWTALHDARANHAAALDALDEAEERLGALQSGLPNKRVQYFNWRRKQSKAA